MTDIEWQQATSLLRDGIEQAGLDVTSEQQLLMIQYLQLLTKWNKAFNLTSITQKQDMVIKHILDSLIVDRWVTGNLVLDVGTGAGIPGVPLAIVNRDKNFVLLDSNGKKTRFITQAVKEMGITNVDVVQARIESFEANQAFQQIICRAYSSLFKFVEQTHNLMNPSIELLAMKGQFPSSEIEELPEHVVVKDQHEIDVPFLNEQRHLIILKPREA